MIVECGLEVIGIRPGTILPFSGLMDTLSIEGPVSGGIFLTYKCTGSCKHCMYACSPHWEANWIDAAEAEGVLEDLGDIMPMGSRPGRGGVGINRGLHFTGGEPFLNYDLLLRLVKAASQLEIQGTFVETNCFWCSDDDKCRDRFQQLGESGLEGILISVNPFTLEHIPLENSIRAIDQGRKVFGEDLMVYQESFLETAQSRGVRGTMKLPDTISLLGMDALTGLEILPRGRAPYSLQHLYRSYPAREFFGLSCERELRRGWHFHIDNFFNYIPGYCGGISLGDARDLDSILDGVDLGDYPLIGHLANDIQDLCRFAKEEFNYRERREGYISKCHLCLDIRRHIAALTNEYRELQPIEFYSHI